MCLSDECDEEGSANIIFDDFTGWIDENGAPVSLSPCGVISHPLGGPGTTPE